MKPIKNRTKKPIPPPDAIPEELPAEDVGGTDVDAESSRESGIVDSVEGDEGGGGYGRPRIGEEEDEPM